MENLFETLICQCFKEVFWIKAEIQAQHYLLSVSKRYNVPKNEIKETERNLEYWKKELKKYEN